MKAVLLAAGMGTRLRPLTNKLPKQMVEIGGKPLMWYNLRQLAVGRVSKVWINLHHLPEIIQDYVGDGSRWGLKVKYSEEQELLGTAGALRNPKSGIEKDLQGEECFIVLYGDSFNNIDYKQLVDFCIAKRAAVGFNLHTSFTPAASGVVVTDESDRVLRMVEKPLENKPPSKKSYSGAYVCSRRVFDYITPGSFSDFGKQVIPEMIARGERVFAKDFGFYSQDIGSMEKLEKARRDWEEGKRSMKHET
jgi:NDP-sugar pyrophosphorylase family protein